MTNNKQQTSVDLLIINFKESITYLESSLDCCNHKLTKIVIKARLSQARYFLTYAIEAKEMEKEQIEEAFENGMNAVNIHNLEQYYNKTYGGNK